MVLNVPFCYFPIAFFLYYTFFAITHNPMLTMTCVHVQWKGFKIETGKFVKTKDKKKGFYKTSSYSVFTGDYLLQLDNFFCVFFQEEILLIVIIQISDGKLILRFDEFLCCRK